jgi:hypothetical protein
MSFSFGLEVLDRVAHQAAWLTLRVGMVGFFGMFSSVGQTKHLILGLEIHVLSRKGVVNNPIYPTTPPDHEPTRLLGYSSGHQHFYPLRSMSMAVEPGRGPGPPGGSTV